MPTCEPADLWAQSGEGRVRQSILIGDMDYFHVSSICSARKRRLCDSHCKINNGCTTCMTDMRCINHRTRRPTSNWLMPVLKTQNRIYYTIFKLRSPSSAMTSRYTFVANSRIMPVFPSNEHGHNMSRDINTFFSNSRLAVSLIVSPENQSRILIAPISSNRSHCHQSRNKGIHITRFAISP